MSNDREQLKALLLSEEIAQLKALQELLQNKQKFSEKVSEVLDPATDLAFKANPAFEKKLSKIDPQSYVEAIKANKQTFIDALLPIIGPMIRKSVTSSIRRFVADVNRAVEMGVSAKALKWRWLAFRTGVPFTEIVFNNTIEYQVQQVFLIDNHSGLLITHVGQEELLHQDKDAISSMLTAIQDFVKDSMGSDGEGLSAAELGDDLLWLIHGSKANIAAVIKGAPTQRLNDAITTTLEHIHIEFNQQLAEPNDWNNNVELKTELEKLLVTKTQSEDEEQQQGINFWPWLLVVCGLLAWWGWSAYQHKVTLNKITNQLNQTAGFMLTGLEYDGGQFIATGLKDPSVEFKNLADNLTVNSTPFLSLADDIIVKRVKNILNDEQLEVTSIDNQVTIQGRSAKDPAWQQKITLIQQLPGVAQLHDATQKIPPKATLADYLANNPPPDKLVVKPINDTLFISGLASQENLTAFNRSIEQFGKVDASQVEIINRKELTQYINRSPLNFSQTRQINETGLKHLSTILSALNKIRRLNTNTSIKLTAQSDCQGSIEQSNTNNQARLNLVQIYLVDNGIPSKHIQTAVIACTSTTNEVDADKIGVWFEVLL